MFVTAFCRHSALIVHYVVDDLSIYLCDIYCTVEYECFYFSLSFFCVSCCFVFLLCLCCFVVINDNNIKKIKTSPKTSHPRPYVLQSTVSRDRLVFLYRSLIRMHVERRRRQSCRVTPCLRDPAPT